MKKILFIVILCIVIIITLSMNIKVKEGIPMFKSMSDNGQISDIDSLRSVLEMLYTVTYSNTQGMTSDNVPNTLCYRAYMLGSMIPSLLGGLAKQDMQTLWSIYGQAAIPTGVKAIPPTKVPIIATSKDYAMFMKLCSGGEALATFISSKPPIWTQLQPPGSPAYTPPPPIHDLCDKTDAASKKKVAQVKTVYNDVVEALKYFHNQLDTSSMVYPGDSDDTSLYQPNPK